MTVRTVRTPRTAHVVGGEKCKRHAYAAKRLVYGADGLRAPSGSPSERHAQKKLAVGFAVRQPRPAKRRLQTRPPDKELSPRRSSVLFAQEMFGPAHLIRLVLLVEEDRPKLPRDRVAAFGLDATLLASYPSFAGHELPLRLV
jgi:hypothetical protein